LYLKDKNGSVVSDNKPITWRRPKDFMAPHPYVPPSEAACRAKRVRRCCRLEGARAKRAQRRSAWGEAGKHEGWRKRGVKRAQRRRALLRLKLASEGESFCGGSAQARGLEGA
jgi:hypothetical protein